jgi:glutamyl-tRNA reductase
MFLSVCGFNHKSANLQERERFQLSRAELSEALSLYQALSGAEESAIIATCNRVEFYRVSARKANHYEEVIRFFDRLGAEDPAQLQEICYCHQGTTAARHLFRVASGLDSMVLGEDQVLHQVKEAYSIACAVGGPGKYLHKLFHLAFQTSKRVRSETKIATGPRSIPSSAYQLLLQKMRWRPIERALVVGVNEIANILLDNLNRNRIPAVIANRTLHHAQKLAETYNAEAASLDKIPSLLSQVNVVFTTTASCDYLITPEHIAPHSAESPLFIIDLAVPRNVSPEVALLVNIKLLDLDDLEKFLSATDANRHEDIPLAESIVEEMVQTFSLWRTKIQRQEKLLQLKSALNQTRMEELEKIKLAFRKSDYKVLEAFSKNMVRELLRVAPGWWEEE